MGRLRRFTDHRFVGARDTMRVYDCDDEADFSELEARAVALEASNQLQTFGPDTLSEARNRGFEPARGRSRVSN
ncbi:MAG TPA: hypothetical protein VLB67_02415 [Acidimicrobiia bacterium]|nr:hypothetical protein [Acidimicrobiia bacterium]